MIHTFRIALHLNSEHIHHLRDAYGIEVLEIGSYLGNGFHGVSISGTRNPFNGILNFSMIIDVPSLFDRGDITVKDLALTEIRIKDILGSLFGDRELYNQHRLMRIDFRYDAIVADKDLREAYIKLFSKSYRRKERRLKELGRLNVQGLFEPYDTGLEHVNHSIESAVYDKMAERIAKKEPIMSYEQNVLRFEVRLKEDFIAYQQRQYGFQRSLKVYFSEEMYQKMMKKYILGTYLTNDFLRYSEGIRRVKESQFSVQKKRALESFLRLVSRGDLSSPQKSIAPATFNSRLADYEALHFHPVTIPDSWKNMPDHLENPLAFLLKDML